MTTCYIDRKEAELRADGHAIAVYENGRRSAAIPLGPLTRLVIVGNVHLETRLLHRLAEQGVVVCLIGGRRHQVVGSFAATLHGDGRRRLAQYRAAADEARVREQAAAVVRTKVAGQVALLQQLQPHARRGEVVVTSLERMETTRARLAEEGVAVESQRGLEGAAAAAYFAAYQECFPPSLDFTDRNRRPPRDPVNALLSLTYTLVHAEHLREVAVAGLDPMVGYLHERDFGRESLVCDLVEGARPAADGFIWRLFHERTFTGRDFSSGDERPGCYLKKGARARYYPLYEAWAEGERSGWRDTVRALVRWLGEEWMEENVVEEEG